MLDGAAKLTAAWLWAGPDAIVSHRAAGRLYGLEAVPDGHLELLIPNGKRMPGVVARRMPQPRPRTRTMLGLPVTTVERTMLDLAAVMPAPATGKALDEALRRQMTTLSRLRDELQATGGRGRKGSAVLGRLVSMRDDRDGRLESELERAALRLFRDPRLPGVEVQHRVLLPGARSPSRLDFAWPSRLVGVEAHSYKWHFGLDRWKKDLARDNRLKLLGWTILHYTWDDIHFEPERVLREIRQALERAPADELFPATNRGGG